MLDLDIIVVFPVKLDVVLTVDGFRSRGVGCNARVTSWAMPFTPCWAILSCTGQTACSHTVPSWS